MKASPSKESSTGRISPADARFGNAPQRVLGLLSGQPERSFYANELVALPGSRTPVAPFRRTLMSAAP